MNDTELTSDEEQRLSSMLRRAADGLEVPSTPESVPAPSGRSRRPWLAAAALIAVAAVGTTWWAVDRGGDEIVDLVDRPDEPLLQRVIEDEGLWRLPSADSGLELLDVVVSDNLLEPGAEDPRVDYRAIAVDDARAPTTWIAVLPGSWGPLRSVDLLDDLPGEPPISDGAGVNLVSTGEDSPTGSSWFEVSLDAEQGSGAEPRLTVAARGIPDDRVFELLTDMVEGFDPPDDTWPAVAALDSLALPDELAHGWADEGVPPENHLGLLVEEHDGGRAMFSITETGLTPAVASLLQQLSLEALDFVQPDETAAFRTTLRPDLGPGAFTYGSTGTESLVVFSRDGVSLHVGAVAQEEWGPMPEPLPFDRQVELIGQLRSVSAEEVLDEVLGDMADADQGVTTTTMGGPDD